MEIMSIKIENQKVYLLKKRFTKNKLIVLQTNEHLIKEIRRAQTG